MKDSSLGINCRSCAINQELSGEPGQHDIIDLGLYCPLCHYSGKSYFHSEHDDLAGEAIECGSCHNYILYVYKDIIWKDELYFPNNWFLIRDLESQNSTFSIGSSALGSETIATISHIIQFETADQLLNKLKTILVFS